MENVIQHVKIEDIVPRNHRHTLNDIKALEELAISIKENGIKKPLNLKKINDRYEIISGNKRYKAAILAGLSKVPAIIEESDSKYLLNYITGTDDNNYPKSIKTDPDIINLSELSKEYERDDFNMNNELMNNNLQHQPLQENVNTPTFGGRFFPSLEDEPTNMAFNTTIDSTPMQEPQSMNNFIDLTGATTTVSEPVVTEQTPGLNNNIDVQPLQNNMVEQPIMNNQTMPFNNDSILNIENLTQNNSMVQPVQEPQQEMIIPNQTIESTPTNIDNSFQEIINDFQPQPTPVMNFEIPEVPTGNQNIVSQINPMDQFAMPMNNSMPVMDNQINNITQDVIPQSFEQPIENQQAENIIVNQPEPIMESPINMVLNIDNNSTQPIIEQPTQSIQPEIVPQQQEVIVEPQQMVNQPMSKDIMPVINTLKAVGINLENFGYTIRITDEDLPTSYKITIEVDK